MNTRDPFNIRRAPAIQVLQASASIAAHSALSISRQVFESGKQALEKGRQSLESSPTTSPSPPDLMSFSIPSNLPSFESPQRVIEDALWGNSATNATGSQGIRDKAAGLFESQGLPMYKDKPYSYTASRRRHIWWRRKRTILVAILILGLLSYWLGLFASLRGSSVDTAIGKNIPWKWRTGTGKGDPADWNDRREKVKEAFILNWNAYDQHAWGMDEFHPLSKKGNQMSPKGLGWIIVDSLDTLMIMNLTTEISHAREWIQTSLDYNQDTEVNTFEITIRMLGGLLSAYYLSTELQLASNGENEISDEDLYLEKAVDLADRLLGAFESPSGIPYSRVNLNASRGSASLARSDASSIAEAGTLQLELKYLAQLTGERQYWDKAEKVMQVLDDTGQEDGLLPIFISADSAKFHGNHIRLGSRGDSYYEYLIKQYLQTSEQEPIYLEMWNEALKGIRQHLITYSNPSHLTILAELPKGIGYPIYPKMDHLVCFMPGVIALGATGGLTVAEAQTLPSWTSKQDSEIELARQLMQTCWGMYRVTRTGLAPEIAHFQIYDPPKMEGFGSPPASLSDDEDADWKADFIIEHNNGHNLQRPETVESLFYLWRITGDTMYREWGWQMFKAFVKYSTVPRDGGFTSVENVNKIPVQLMDNMESFWLSETLKYFYLLFSPNDLLPLDQIIINTEAHPFPRFELSKILSTGWKRRPRGADGKILNPALPVGANVKYVTAQVQTVN
ncbi:MAG: mannosyl-oligosaccharide alpha-1,2-mannosidase [Trizodia sp. TS-e1964]|nr:MAG: mannosyl-oligosaccharide alpha-1,2-mannosidase [Trizodia sp. TS-e1964]